MPKERAKVNMFFINGFVYLLIHYSMQFNILYKLLDHL